MNAAREAGWRSLLLPLVPIYAAGLGIKRRLAASGWPKQKRLRNPVISIGSLSAGGAGKTPVVLLLAEMLNRRGYAVRILTRGYRRRSKLVERVKLGREAGEDAGRYGDEPVLLAQRSKVPVYVGADRYQAGLVAEEAPAEKTVVHLLDDGFQHRQLARDLDIVLLTRKDVDDALLPAGDLREPLTTLREADVIVLREEEAAGLHDFVSEMTGGTGSPPMWVIRRRLEFATEEEGSWPDRPLAFCGIARPEGFFEMLALEGCSIAGRWTFRDHHRYEERDVQDLIGKARRCGADGFITTEKDAVKLTRPMRSRLEWVGPIAVPRLHVELMDEKTAMEQMISMVEGMDRRRRR